MSKIIQRTISEARIESDAPDHLVIGSGLFGRLGIILLVGLLVLLAIINGITWWLQNEGPVLAIGTSATCLLPALVLAMAVAFSTKLTVDAQQKTLTVTRNYLLGLGPWPRRREETASFSQISRIQYVPGPGWNHHIELAAGDDLRVTLQFGSRRQQAIEACVKIRERLGLETGPTDQAMQATRSATANLTYDTMLKQIRSWAYWMVGFGVLHLIASGTFNAPWGILLVAVGLASLYFRDAAMFVVYAVTLAWAGISNLVYGTGGWKAFALIQAYFVYSIMQQFFRYRRLQAEQMQKLLTENPDQPSLPNRSARIFPWAGLVIGSFSLTGLIVVLFGAFALMMTGNGGLPAWLGTVEGLVVDGAVLGFAIGLGAVLSGCRRKFVAIAGCVLSALTLIIELGLALVVRL